MFHRIFQGNTYDIVPKLLDNSIDCLITSSPYYKLRDYNIPPVIIGGNPICKHEWIEMNSNADLRHRGKNSYIGKDNDTETLGNGEQVEGAICKHCNAFFGQLGHEPHPDIFVQNLVYLFDLIRPKLKDTATVFVNISDTYSQSGGSGSPKKLHTSFGKTQDVGSYQKPHKATGYPPKTRLCIPERFCTAMVDNGWILRNSLVWFRSNSTPESVLDRFSRKYEMVYFFTKSPDYYFNINAIKRTITTETIERYQRALKLGAYSINGKYSNGEMGRPTQPPSWVSELSVPSKTKQMSLFSEDLSLEKETDSKFKEVDNPETFGSPRARNNHKFELDDGYRQGMNRDESSISIQRKYNPNQKEIAAFIKKYFLIENNLEDELNKAFGGYKWRHWVRTDKDGSSLPLPDDWIVLKSIYTDLPILYDEQMLTTVEVPQTITDNPAMGNPWDLLIIPNKGIREKHYASFNPALVEYLLTAGCPELVCSKCGAPKRQVYSSGGNSAFNIRVRDVKEGRLKYSDRTATEEEIAGYNEEEYVSDEKEQVISQGCNCNVEYVPATVFDPFAGSFTTCGVAKEMGRSSIGVEMNEDYISIGIKRFNFNNTFYDFKVVRE